MDASQKINYVVGEFEIEPDSRRLLRDGEQIHLTKKPFGVLLYLIENRERMVSRQELLEKFWDGHEVYEETLTKCIGAIRKTLGDNKEQPQFIQTHWAEGYRFIHPVEEKQSDFEIERIRTLKITVEEEDEPETKLEKPVLLPKKSARRKFFAIPALSALIIAAIFFSAWYPHKLKMTGAPIESIAVLPFENKSSDADTDYLSDGLAESLIYRLSQFSNLKVSPTSSVFRYKGKETDPQVIANELGVDSIITGRIVKRGDSLTVSVNLVDARNGKSLWGEQYERKMSELLTTQRQIASEITDKLHLKLSGEGEQKLTKKYTENNEAYQLYLRGRYEWNKFSFDGLTNSIPLFERVIQIDPTFALAYSGMADSYINLGVDYISAHDTMPRARVAAIQAIALDDSLAEAHTSLGSYKMFYEWDITGAEESYRKAISLNPRYANARHFYSHCLQFSGRETEALREMKTAVELEPFSLINNAELGWAYYLANQHDAAIEQLHKTIKLDPSFSHSYLILGQVYADKGNYTEAVAALREGQRLSPDWLELQAVLAYTYASAGERGKAEALLTKLVKSAADTYVNPVLIAAVYVALADNDQAIAWLERGYRERCSWMRWIAIEPQLKRLRSDLRFQEIVRRVNK